LDLVLRSGDCSFWDCRPESHNKVEGYRPPPMKRGNENAIETCGKYHRLWEGRYSWLSGCRYNFWFGVGANVSTPKSEGDYKVCGNTTGY
jgi:hypothetical protein